MLEIIWWLLENYLYCICCWERMICTNGGNVFISGSGGVLLESNIAKVIVSSGHHYTFVFNTKTNFRKVSNIQILNCVIGGKFSSKLPILDIQNITFLTRNCSQIKLFASFLTKPLRIFFTKIYRNSLWLVKNIQYIHHPLVSFLFPENSIFASINACNRILLKALRQPAGNMPSKWLMTNYC